MLHRGEHEHPVLFCFNQASLDILYREFYTSFIDLYLMMMITMTT